MMLTNLPMDAEEAQMRGFIASVHPAAELPAATEELAERIAHMPSGALRRAEVLLQASPSPPAEPPGRVEPRLILEAFPPRHLPEGALALGRKPKTAAQTRR